MICHDCRVPDGHEACKERNKNKQGKDCDCLHRPIAKEVTDAGQRDVVE